MLKVIAIGDILVIEVKEMELLQLQYFCEAAACENFSHTAKRFGVPPSDVSQSVKRLEKELQVSLFERRANSLALNEQGRVFWEKARAGLRLLEQARAAVCARENAGELRLAINTNRRLVMQAVDIYRRRYPEVNIVIHHGVQPSEGDFHLLIAQEGLLQEGWQQRRVLSEEILLAVPRDHRLATQDITAEALSECAFITMSSGSNLYGLTEQICRAFGVTPRIALQSDDPFYIRKCVELGLGVAFVPSISWQGQFPEGVVLRTAGGYHRNTCVYWREADMVGCVGAFLDILLAEEKM